MAFYVLICYLVFGLPAARRVVNCFSRAEVEAFEAILIAFNDSTYLSKKTKGSQG
jgi:hypothetical protein